MKKIEFSYLKNLMDQNNHFEALLGLLQFTTEANLIDEYCDDEARENSKKLLNHAFNANSINYPATRHKLLKIIKNTKDRDTLDTALFLLFYFGDYSTLAAMRNISIQFAELDFYAGFADYVGRILTLAHPQNTPKKIKEFKLKSVNFCAYLMNSKIFFSRDRKNNLAPVFNGGRRIELGTGTFAVSYDPVKETILLADKVHDKVIAVDRKTLKIVKELKCPEHGVRGLAIHQKLRRGFVNCEFANVMYSFDLDTFKIRKRITGLSVRPERIHIDEKSDTIITGNLGLYKMLPSEDTYFIQRWKTSHEEKVTDGESVTVIDARAEEVINTLKVGRRPTAIDISSNYIASGNFLDNTVHIFKRNDLSSPSCVAKIDPFPDIKFTLDLNDKFSGTILKVPVHFRSVMVEGIKIIEKKNLILVAGFEGSILIILDLTSGETLDIVPVQGGPMDVIIDSEETRAFVSCHNSSEVSVVDIDNRTEICRLKVGPESMDPGLYDGMLIVPDANGATVYNIEEINLFCNNLRN